MIRYLLYIVLTLHSKLFLSTAYTTVANNIVLKFTYI